MKQAAPEIKGTELKDRIAELNAEFKDYLSDLKFIKKLDDTELKTFSPLDMLVDFEQQGLQRVREVSKSEMMNDTDGMRKLLANMLQHCRPGMLSDDDAEQLSGINGREMREF